MIGPIWRWEAYLETLHVLSNRVKVCWPVSARLSAANRMKDERTYPCEILDLPIELRLALRHLGQILLG